MNINLGKYDILHYFVLVLGLGVFSVLFGLFKHQVGTQLYISFFACVFYAAWGISHHLLESRFSRTIAIEYISLSALVFSVIALVLLL